MHRVIHATSMGYVVAIEDNSKMIQIKRLILPSKFWLDYFLTKPQID